MADITMCNGIYCNQKEKCLRYVAKPSEWRQAYFSTPPIKGGKCDMFWDTREIKTHPNG
jgi:hypothetical protein